MIHALESLLKTIRLVTLMSGIGCCLFSGCAPVQPLTAPSARTKPDTAYLYPADSRKILDVLYQQVEAWEGVPYRLGGLSKEGIDCSGFVYMTYLTRFNIRLPRSTYQQSQTGDYVFQRDLRAGDLVFFRIGYSTRHVGIYLENDLFAHASKSSGVMISHLQDTYWSKRYWKAVRIKIDRP
jgi:cell wall-associated NlpC family hydrolase